MNTSAKYIYCYITRRPNSRLFDATDLALVREYNTLHGLLLKSK